MVRAYRPLTSTYLAAWALWGAWLYIHVFIADKLCSKAWLRKIIIMILINTHYFNLKWWFLPAYLVNIFVKLHRDGCQIFQVDISSGNGWVPSGNKPLPEPMLTTIISLWPSDVIWWLGSRSTLAQVMACCLTAPSHYLNQCWLMISGVLWHSPDSNFTENTQDIYYWNEFGIY